MPVKKCTRNGEQGYQWGDSGECYLPSEEGGDGQAKRKAILQGYAVEGGSLEELQGLESLPVVELASLIKVPILKAGVFQSSTAGAYEVKEEELDDIVYASNKLLPIVREAADTGIYRGNELFSEKLKHTGKPIPGVLNIVHQKNLFDPSFSTQVKEFISGVSVSYDKELVDGKQWVVASFSGMTPEMTETLLTRYPFRSAELLPLTDPETGVKHPKVIRSTAFLDVLTPPAVPGQTPAMVAEFAGGEDPVVTISINREEEKHAMNDEGKTVDVAALQKLEAASTQQAEMIAELQASLKAQEAEKKALEEFKAASEAKITELQRAKEQGEATAIVASLSAKSIEHEGRMYQVSKAFVDTVAPVILGNGIVELQEGEDHRKKLSGVFEGILELAKSGSILVPLGTVGTSSYEHGDSQPKDKEALITELMSEDESLTPNQAWVKATEILKEYEEEVA